MTRSTEDLDRMVAVVLAYKPKAKHPKRRRKIRPRPKAASCKLPD